MNNTLLDMQINQIQEEISQRQQLITEQHSVIDKLKKLLAHKKTEQLITNNGNKQITMNVNPIAYLGLHFGDMPLHK